MQVINGYGPMGYGSSLEGLGTTATIDFGYAVVPIETDPYELEQERIAATQSVIMDQINAANATNPNVPLLGPSSIQDYFPNNAAPGSAAGGSSSNNAQSAQKQVGQVSNTTAILFLAAAVGVLFLVR